jgi:hypothetical protein
MKKLRDIRGRREDIDLSLEEALEWGTDEMVAAYKKDTPGELDELTTFQLIDKIKSQTVSKKKYDFAAELLKKIWDKKSKERRGNPKHSLEYYSSVVSRQVNGIDARTLADFFRKKFATESYLYAKEQAMPLHSVYRPHSVAYYLLFNECRELKLEVYNDLDKHLLEQTDIGQWDMYEGEEVPLDIPLVEEKDVELNKPKRGGSKKFYVYVKNDKGNVVKVSFGDTSGLKAKIDDPEARKSFVARHQCDQKKDKTTPGYWACRLPMYAKELGLEGGGDFFW